MSKLLGRIKKRSGVGRKSWLSDWAEPEFWNLEAAREPFLSDAGYNNKRERIGNSFEGYTEGAYKRNSTVFSCMSARQMAFSEVRFLWTKFNNGRRSGELFDADPSVTTDSSALALLEKPWPGGTTGELLSRMIQDADLAGNFYATITDDAGNFGRAATGPGRRITRLRPSWVNILLGSHSGDLLAADTKVIGYEYQPVGPQMDSKSSLLLLPDEVCHFSPIPDPGARFRGMSWLTPVIREIEADTGATLHKKKFFDNAAVPNMAVKFDKDIDEDQFDEFVEKFRETHQGAVSAYKTLFLMGGADVTPLSHNFQQLEFNESQSKGESRIAAAAGVPITWVGFSQVGGGKGNPQGAETASRRRFADGTIRPLWRMAASSLERLFDVPKDCALWYDDRDIAFLREDAQDRATIFQTNMNALDSGIKAGFKPDAAIEALRDYDITKLAGQHTGLTSVQMQEPHGPEVEIARDQADLVAVQAETIATLATTGLFTEESIVAAVGAGDLALLKKSPDPPPLPAGAGPALPGLMPPASPVVVPTQDDNKPGGGN